uniref:2'-phosphotransferase n=1 Tax=Xenopsylla cheopis TaxID=163159 RepID=A0A6M2DNV4_XENCH
MSLSLITSDDCSISRRLSWLLRHGAQKVDIFISDEGFIKVHDILRHQSFKDITLEDILRVVSNNDKQRFSVRKNPGNGELEIKANQGHTISLNNLKLLEIPLITSYTEVIHGTYYSCWKAIKKEGLRRMKRMHIHFAKDLNSISGIRKNCQVLIYVDIKLALKDGYKFFESENQVILCPGNINGLLPKDYFLKVIDFKTNCPLSY